MGRHKIIPCIRIYFFNYINNIKIEETMLFYAIVHCHPLNIYLQRNQLEYAIEGNPLKIKGARSPYRSYGACQIL